MGAIEKFVQDHKVEAGCVLACVGSLTKAAIRLADQDEISKYEDKFEIVSLTGTLSIHGSYLHISIADGNGRTIGGHLSRGCRVYTTAEIVIASIPDLIYKREDCEYSGYPGLRVYPK
jgi:predicted DNA-binding protein with PD1-like motif